LKGVYARLDTRPKNVLKQIRSRNSLAGLSSLH